MSVIEETSTVKVHYTGKFTDGYVFDSSKSVDGDERFTDKEPLEVELGKGLLIPGFEAALKGMKEGETKTVTIEAKDAYGEVLNERFQEIDRNQVPETVKEGEVLQANGPNGTMVVVVKEVKENTVVINANHPLAGKDLVFDLEVISIS